MLYVMNKFVAPYSGNPRMKIKQFFKSESVAYFLFWNILQIQLASGLRKP